MKWKAPCGCDGEPIIGTYVACLSGHDGPPKKCSRCGSKKMRPYVAFNIPPGSWACDDCGRVRWPGI